MRTIILIAALLLVLPARADSPCAFVDDFGDMIQAKLMDVSRLEVQIAHTSAVAQMAARGELNETQAADLVTVFMVVIEFLNDSKGAYVPEEAIFDYCTEFVNALGPRG